MKRTFTFQLEVTTDARVGESTVEEAINAALDEPPCEWGDWYVGIAKIVKVTKGKKSA